MLSEKTPVLKAQALKAIDDAKVRRAELQEQAKHDKAARDEMIRTMYDISLSPEDVNFIDEAVQPLWAPVLLLRRDRAGTGHPEA